ncbi:hypothetical protein NKG05_02970 [Oerskovia sp. M15]
MRPTVRRRPGERRRRAGVSTDGRVRLPPPGRRRDRRRTLGHPAHAPLERTASQGPAPGRREGQAHQDEEQQLPVPGPRHERVLPGPDRGDLEAVDGQGHRPHGRERGEESQDGTTDAAQQEAQPQDRQREATGPEDLQGRVRVRPGEPQVLRRRQRGRPGQGLGLVEARGVRGLLLDHLGPARPCQDGGQRAADDLRGDHVGGDRRKRPAREERHLEAA